MRKYWTIGSVIALLICVLLVLSIATSWVGLIGVWIPLNENQVLYLFSTSSQVVAAVYGLTLTGFIFLRNELSREEFEDETLGDAVATLKTRYFIILIFVTVVAFSTILICNGAISIAILDRSRVSLWLINSGQSFFFVSLISVAYFIFDVTRPKRVEFVSKTLQAKLDPTSSTQKQGSLEEFVRNYNQIEDLLTRTGYAFQKPPEVVALSANINNKPPKRFSNARLAEALWRNERISHQLFQTLRELITLRNSIIHGADPVVSQALVESSARVLEELRAALDDNNRNAA